MKHCESCGHQIDDTARTCPKCGRVFTNASGVAGAVVVGLILGGALLVWLLSQR